MEVGLWEVISALGIDSGRITAHSGTTLYERLADDSGGSLGCPLRNGSIMKKFEVQFRYRDRNEGTVESTIKAEASSLPGAVGKATREFVKGLDRKQRFDMNRNGLEITAKSFGATTEARADTSAEAATR